MSLLTAIESDTLTVVPLPDDVIDALGHDPRSHYVETYWLGTLGPPTTQPVPIGYQALKFIQLSEMG